MLVNIQAESTMLVSFKTKLATEVNLRFKNIICYCFCFGHVVKLNAKWWPLKTIKQEAQKSQLESIDRPAEAHFGLEEIGASGNKAESQGQNR